MTRVAMVGTFDVANFGDLLFPLLTEHELGKRLDHVEVVPYGGADFEQPQWPYQVRSVGRLPDEIGDFDLMLVGGGHLIRCDAPIAHWYGPLDSSVHYPLGLWLSPTLMAGAAGVPVAWNAPGVVSGFPPWVRPLLRSALEVPAYLAVRDQRSACLLAEAGGDVATVRVVPDTAFGVGALLPESESDAFASWRASVELRDEYVVVQPSPLLRPHRAQIERFVEEAASAGMAVVELPIAPAHDDRVGVLDLRAPTLGSDQWPAPRLLTEVIARAQAVVGQSLHLAVVAAATGVPVHRAEVSAGQKYDVLEALERVHIWRDGDGTPVDLGRNGLGSGVRTRLGDLSAHWDAIAALASGGRRARMNPVLRMLEGLPGLAEDAGRRLPEARRERDSAAAHLRDAERVLRDVLGSRSWRITKPLRAWQRALRRHH